MGKDTGERVEMSKKNDNFEDVMLCKGVVLSASFFEKKENRFFSMLLKGVMVYLISMGSIGFYLSAFDIEYNAFFCHIVIFIMAIVCALLYYKLYIENIGYLLLLGIFGLAVMTYKTIINSGFYAVANITVEEAANFFNQPFQKVYTEQVEDRYLTITMVVLFIGIVLDVLLNVYISRRMQYVTAVFIVMTLNMIPLYLEAEPNNIYVIMYLIGIGLTYVLKSGKHFGAQVSNKRDDFLFQRKKNKNIEYKCDFKVMLQGAIIVSIFIIVSVTAITAFKPKKTFNVGYTPNKYKELSMSMVSTLLLEGFDGFRKSSENVGGLRDGKLGNVSKIKYDHETDLVVQFTPYSYESVYLRDFVGVDYKAYSNRWIEASKVELNDGPEREALKSDWIDGNEYAARGVMRIRNIDVGRTVHLPYYYDEYSYPDNNGWYQVVYYPRQDETDGALPEDSSLMFEDRYLDVPKENYDAVDTIIEEIDGYNLNTDEEKIAAVKKYFSDNIPYTIKPGMTPKNKDFVNYFLLKNKKGYCSHYASAATLIFRRLGIPARYVEGYMVDYYQITSMGELVEGAEYNDYFDGYSSLGETALIEIDVTDADAHAWVEVYDEKIGWYVVEVTPAGTEEDVEDFWDAYEEFGKKSSLSDDILSGTSDFLNFRVSNKTIRRIYITLAVIIGILLATFVGIKLFGLIRFFIIVQRAEINDKLILKYSARCRRLKKHDKEFAKCLNYTTQVDYLDPGNTKIINILEKAGFSDKIISGEEYSEAVEWTKHNVKRLRRSQKIKTVVEE